MCKKTEIGSSSQVLESFEAFSLGVWSLCVVACLFMVVFLITEEVLLQLARSLQSIKLGTHFYEVLVLCSRYGAIDDGGLSSNQIISKLEGTI